MTTREQIKSEIDQLPEQDLLFLHRIIQALTPTAPIALHTENSAQDEAWSDFVQSTYGVFRDEPLERPSQETLEIRKTPLGQMVCSLLLSRPDQSPSLS